MNTTPDEEMLALWLDDELDGDAFSMVEAWAASQPEQLAAREEVRRWRATVKATVPASVEPPFPDFFNSRVSQAIRDLAPKQPAAAVSASRDSWWRAWLLPVSAMAGMVFAFWMGTQTGDSHSSGPVVYTPETGVDAKWFASTSAEATVIVLEGVEAIPDSRDFNGTAMLPLDREPIASTGEDANEGGKVAR
jgi:anti-sigma factor RsiW